MWEIFEGEFLFMTPLTTLLQIYFALIMYSKVIFKGIIDPDNTLQVELYYLKHESVKKIIQPLAADRIPTTTN